MKSIEQKRGCGYRKPGGLYLFSGAPAMVCCKLPYHLESCPCCGAGIKQSRGFTWINTNLFETKDCSMPWDTSATCPLNMPDQKAGLLWVGARYYTPDSFIKESNEMGISKRIAQLPRDLKIGKTWVFLAHPAAFNGLPGVFASFIPQRIDYILKGDETPEQIERMEKRGITIIDLVKDREQIELF